MRVISGSAKGRKLFSPEGENTRPTTDRVKESIFNTIRFFLPDAECLDLFAGSGQMGIEGLSAGAKKCAFIDISAESIELIKKNLKLTGFFEKSKVAQMDYKMFLQTTKDSFDVVFIDPPYNSTTSGKDDSDGDILFSALNLLTEKMNENGIAICEHEKKRTIPDIIMGKKGKFVLQKRYKYGTINVSAYNYKIGL